MSLLDQLKRWVREPPPDYLFEVSERALASVQTRSTGTLKTSPLGDKGVNVSPSEPNMARVDLLRGAFPNGNGTKRAKAALVIPDYATRMSVLDFEELPDSEEQRLALVRFRLRKSVPFSIDEARVSCTVQERDPASKKAEVLAAAVAGPVLAEYEDLFRSAGYQIGLVLPSSIAALPLCSALPDSLTLLAKLSGSVFSILLLEGRRVRVVRCVDLSSEESDPAEQPVLIATLLHQTLAFAEDELSSPVRHLLLCGFGPDAAELGSSCERDFGLSWAVLGSRFGLAGQENAGLLGLLEQYTA